MPVVRKVAAGFPVGSEISSTHERKTRHPALDARPLLHRTDGPGRAPLRRIEPLVDGILEAMSTQFDAMYAEGGRHSVPPERLLKAMVLMALFSVRSERRFCEELSFNLLYRWFLDMDLSERPFDPNACTRTAPGCSSTTSAATSSLAPYRLLGTSTS